MEPCRLLEWDSEFFGKRIATVEGRRLTAERLSCIDAWCETQSIDCLYFLADAGDAETSRLAHERRFHLVDVRVTLEASLAELPSLAAHDAARIRTAQPEDIAPLALLARISFRGSRFYADPGFPEDRCDDFYETWLRNSYNGFADAVLVAVEAGQAVGFVACHRSTEALPARLGLIAVAPAHQRRGLGEALVCGAYDWWRSEGETTVAVVTQGRNISAQRLFQRSGFRSTALELWYHRWRSDIPPRTSE